MNRMYTAGPDGYCGDEDNGQTSAWYVFSALGFYPVCPGTDEYVLGAPLFRKATLHFENGKSLTIDAPADACVIDITMANAMTGEGTSYANLSKGISLTSEEYGVAFRKDSDLTAKFNELMAKWMNDGTLDALADKYGLTLVK